MEEDIIRFCRKRMAHFKAPKSFAFLSALPKSPQGKILIIESREKCIRKELEMFKNVYVPYKGYWSSPFCKWQESLQNQHAVELAAATAKRFFELRGITPDIFDGIVFGSTIPQKMWFYDAPWFATLMGNPNISGPRVAQACATATVSINVAASSVEVGNNANVLVATADRSSNCPNILWPNPSGLGGKPDFESWMLDGFNFEPTGDTGPLGTANNVAKEHGITREESDALVLDRYTKYLMSTADDREFQKRYMFPVEVVALQEKVHPRGSGRRDYPLYRRGPGRAENDGPGFHHDRRCPDPCGRWECRHDRHHEG